MAGDSVRPKRIEPEREKLLELEKSGRGGSRRKSAERELRERIEEIEAMMEAMPAVVLIAHDPEGRVISGNRVAEESFRMSKGDNISKSAPDGQQPTHF